MVQKSCCDTSSKDRNCSVVTRSNKNRLCSKPGAIGLARIDIDIGKIENVEVTKVGSLLGCPPCGKVDKVGNLVGCLACGKLDKVGKKF